MVTAPVAALFNIEEILFIINTKGCIKKFERPAGYLSGYKQIYAPMP